MTTGAFGRLSRLKLICNALLGERFVRGSLLRELIELAADGPGFEEVLAAAQLLREAVARGLDDEAFNRRLRSIGVALALLEDVAQSDSRPPSLPASGSPDLGGDRDEPAPTRT